MKYKQWRVSNHEYFLQTLKYSDWKMISYNRHTFEVKQWSMDKYEQFEHSLKLEHWHLKNCRLSLACWPTLLVGFDRPFTHKYIKKLIFWWRTRSCLLRCGRAREGRFVRADSCVSVCQPFLVLPPLFDSNLVELFITHKESAMRTNSILTFFLSSRSMPVLDYST